MVPVPLDLFVLGLLFSFEEGAASPALFVPRLSRAAMVSLSAFFFLGEPGLVLSLA